MKKTIPVGMFVIGLTLAVLLLTDRPFHRGSAKEPAKTFEGEEHEAGLMSDREDFPYANHLDGQKYRELYDAIRRMPTENEIEGPLRKGLRSVNTSLTQWESFGPLGVPDKNDQTGNQAFGRIRTMRWYYNTGNSSWERYLGAGSGGLWYGQQVFTSVIWQSLGDNLPNPSVGAIAIDPTNRNVIFVGTGDWGRDNGSGIWKTTDRGQSWNPSGYVGNHTTQILYLVGNTIMIAAGDYGVYRSTDGGGTWDLKTVEPLSPHARCYNLVAASASRLFASLPKYGVYSSNDGGSTWAKVSNGLPTGPPQLPSCSLAIDVAPSNTEVLYAAYTDTSCNQGGIYKTTNSGASWTRTNNPPSYMIGGQGFHTNVIRVHPNNENIVYAASVGFVKSTDGGSTWTTPAGGHGDHTAIEFDPGNSNLMYLCSDGGIILRDDGANTVSNSNYEFDPGAPLQVYEMDYAPTQSDLNLAGTQDNGNILSSYGSQPGSRWLQISGCDGGNNLNIDPLNSSTFFGNQWCGDNSPRWSSLDQGWSFNDIDNGLANGPYTPIRYAKGGARILWTLSMTGLWHSYGKGESWFTSTTNNGNDFPGPYPWPTLTVNNYATLSNKVCYVVWDYINNNNHFLHNYVAEGTPGSMTLSDLGTHFSRLIPDRGNPDEVFAVYPGLIYQSFDHGHNWTDISGNLPCCALTINDIIELYSGPKGVIYAATGMGVFKTIDGGAHWFTFQNGLPFVSVQKMEIVPGTKYDTLRIATYGRGFWQRLIDDPNPYAIPHASIPGGKLHGFNPGNINSVYGAGADGKVFRSTDNGNSWQSLSTGTTLGLNAIGTIGDQTVIAAGDTGTIVRSTDGGATWGPVPWPWAGNATGMSITPGGITWVCAEDGALFKSTNGGTDWIPQPGFPGSELHACKFVSDQHGAVLGNTPVGGGGAVVYITTNGGDEWTPSYLSSTIHMNKMFFGNDCTMVVVGDGGVCARTSNGGTSWNMLNSGVTSNLYDCFFLNDLTGWACGDSGVLLKTEDAGTTWIDIGKDITDDLRALTMSNGNLIIGGDNLILSTSQAHQTKVFYNLGNNWNLVSLPVSVADSSVSTLFPSGTSSAFRYNGTGYVTSAAMTIGQGYWLKFSGDQTANISGSTTDPLSIPVVEGWNLIGSACVSILTSAIASSPPGIVTSQFFGYEGSYVTANSLEPGKAYWVKFNQAGTLVLSSSSLMPPSTGRIKIVATAERPPVPPDGDALTHSGSGIPHAFELAQNYPNPFNPATTISYGLPEEAMVILKVYDVRGREVTTLVNQVQNAGFRSAVWDASSVSTGLYFYTLEADPIDRSPRFVRSGKMLLIK